MSNPLYVTHTTAVSGACFPHSWAWEENFRCRKVHIKPAAVGPALIRPPTHVNVRKSRFPGVWLPVKDGNNWCLVMGLGLAFVPLGVDSIKCLPLFPEAENYECVLLMTKGWNHKTSATRQWTRQGGGGVFCFTIRLIMAMVTQDLAYWTEIWQHIIPAG